MERVLVIQTAFLGDAILGTALLERIHANNPEAQIDYLVRKGNESLFVGHPFLNSVFTFDKSRKFSELVRLGKLIRRRQYAVVYNAQRFASSGMLTAISGAKQTVGYANNPLSFLFSKRVKHRFGLTFSDVHEVDRLLDLYSEANGAVRGLPKLYPTYEDENAVRLLTVGDFITIGPASVWFTKQWPENKWRELIDALPKEMKLYLIGGHGDSDLCQRIASTSTKEVVGLCGKLSLLQTAALMQEAQMNYANDSGPVHLASAVNAPMAAVYCSTIPGFGFTPLSTVSFSFETNEKLDCRPCGIHGHKTCPKKHFNCAQTIDAKQIAKTTL
jgi:heptosyltransferase-2